MHRAAVTKLVLLAAIGALLLLPSVASAVLSGANGRIVYMSGRGFGDAQAKPYLRVAAGSFAFGGNEGPLTTASGQHRHPTWSPDRTKIAYARGGGSCSPDCDIFVLDLTNPFAIPENVTNTPEVNEDRPAWSPDGTRIAYESEVTNGSGQMDILVDPVGAGTTLNLTSSGTIEGKAAWTPNSSEIYYVTGDPAASNSLNIVKEPSAGGAVTNIATSAAENEFQPSISPDGTQMCFTRGTGISLGGGAGTADVIVSLANGGGQDVLTSDNVGTEASHGDYNCTWSPDGQFVAYVRGTFGSGNLVMERADDSSPFVIEIEASQNFDGNPDWAPDGRPVCKDSSVSTGFNQAVTIPLECLDSGPFYERSFVREFVSDGPKNGTVSEEVEQGDQGPSTVVYTPKAGFSGTDTLEVGAFDEIAGFGEEATVKIEVGPAPGGGGGGDAAPVVSGVKVTPLKWKLGSALPVASAVRVGTTIRWRLSEAAATTLTFQRQLPGKRVGGRCVKATGANAAKPNCKLLRNKGAVSVDGKAGANKLGFQGKFSGGKLSPGRYRVAVQARDSAGQRSATKFSRAFTVLPSAG